MYVQEGGAYYAAEAGRYREYDPYDDDKKTRRKQRRIPFWLQWMLLIFGVCFLGVLSIGGHIPSIWAHENEAVAATMLTRGAPLVQQGLQYRRDAEPEIDASQIEDAKFSWEKRQASGRELLLAGVNLVLQQLMESRGTADTSKLVDADFSEAIVLLHKAAEIFSSKYDGENEMVERDYFSAMWSHALLKLHEGECDEVDCVCHQAENTIDMDPKERAQVALLRGYCEEAQASMKAGMYFQLARELDPLDCHETLLDASYQPNHYQLATTLPPKGDGGPYYFPILMDIMLFRELYTLRHQLDPTSTWPGTVWRNATSLEGDPYGANLGWGLNTEGVARAASLIQGNEFVILREFLHPFELAVLERYYKGKVYDGGLRFDEHLGRAVTYQDRVGQWLNHRMVRLMTTLMGEQVKHAYSFLCHYEKRGDHVPFLQSHTDREDNQFTASIQIYSSHETLLWPIFVDKGVILPEHSSWRQEPPVEQTVACSTRNGDALLFLGRRHIHYRERMPAELSLVGSLLLHFVAQSFDFFDYKIVRQRTDPSI